MPTALDVLHSNRRKLLVALLFVNSKQAGMSAKEQLRQLIQSIRSGSKPEQVDSRNYVDAVLYWKQCHAKSEEVAAKLRQKVFLLEQDNQNLRDQIKPEARRPPVANTPRKRKRAQSPLTKSSDVLNHHFHTIKSPPQGAELLDKTDEEESRLPDVEVTRYFSHLYDLQTLLKQAAPTPKDLAGTLIALCNDAVSLILKSGKDEMTDCLVTNNDLLKDGSRHKQVEGRITSLVLVKRTMIHLVNALKSLPARKDIGTLEGKVVYCFAELAKATMLQIEELSKDRELPGNKTWRSTQANTSRGRSESRPLAQAWQIDSTDMRAGLGHFLVQLLASLDLTQPLQKSIRDGALYYILGRAGVLLKDFVFEEAPERRLSSSTPPSMDQSFESAERRNSKSARLSILSEAPFVIWILERALATSQSLNSEQQRGLETVGANCSTTAKPGSDFSLAAYSVVQLQNTMLKAVFEEDETSFEDRLLPISIPISGSDDEPVGAEAEDVPNWYKRKIWTVLGWEALQKSIAWEDC